MLDADALARLDAGAVEQAEPERRESCEQEKARPIRLSSLTGRVTAFAAQSSEGTHRSHKIINIKINPLQLEVAMARKPHRGASP
jgi:hypothetical protein